MFEDLMNQEEFSREQLCVLFVVKTLNDMCDEGWMTGRCLEVSQRGLEAIKDMEPPTTKEIYMVMDALTSEGYIE
jgi:hypothetical protein